MKKKWKWNENKKKMNIYDVWLDKKQREHKQDEKNMSANA